MAWNTSNSRLMHRFVEAFSPYCHHCMSLAPKLQTIYEFYYTSDPLPASQEPKDTKTTLNSFSRYYDIKFAKLDCVAFGTACSKFNVGSYPTMMLFKNGEEVKRTTGDRDMAKLSAFIEECLEIIRPGSRPVGGLPELPTAGVTSFSTSRITPAKDLEPSADVSSKSPSSKGSAPRPNPNPDGVSEPFTLETFERVVSKSLDPWFIKFYAPWCPHCQRMAPSWKGMAREMKGKLNIGEVNCDDEAKLCKDMGVRAYPQLSLFRGPDKLVYDGLRGIGDLIDYANRTVNALGAIEDVTLTEFEALEKTEQVVFVYFYDEATTQEDFMALERLPIKIIGHAKLVKSSDRTLAKRFKVNTFPRLIVSRGSTSAAYDLLMPQDMRNVERMAQWMKSVWLPLVPELTANNAQELMRGKYMVLAILDREQTEAFSTAQHELETAATEWIEKEEHAIMLERQELRDAKQLRVEEAQDRDDERAEMNAKRIRIKMDDIRRKEVAFAWVDGVFWERWVKQSFGISVKDGARVVIDEEDVSVQQQFTAAGFRRLSGANTEVTQNKRYWDTTSSGNAILPSRVAILETLPRVLASPSKISSKLKGSAVWAYAYRGRNSVKSNPVFTAVTLVGAVALVVAMCLRRRRRGKDYSTGSGYLNGHAGNASLLGDNKGD